MIIRILLGVALLAGACAGSRASAAESYDNCTGFIDSLPVPITRQGTWCLRKDLATAITSGSAINIDTSDVIIDCNGFKIGGLSAGNASHTYGIYASNRQNITVRHCNVRGFYMGISLYGGSGHLVENNRLDNNLLAGIYISGQHNRVLANAVYDTGGATGLESATGINANADIIGNTVEGVFTDADTFRSDGIDASGDGVLVSGNRVGGMQITGSGYAYGISASGKRQRIVGNFLRGAHSDTALSGSGITGGAGNSFCIRNVVTGYTTSIAFCQLVDNTTD